MQTFLDGVGETFTDPLFVLKQIAEALGISSTRVRQLEASALAKLEALPVLQQYHDHINSSSESRSLDLIPFV